ncbi:hypothetical protein H2203_007691 [Taxawa tesnikishii (nom. ined.)]|nr:hypothetical protein H2203_007691 [Dothideales sp. JES 119]
MPRVPHPGPRSAPPTPHPIPAQPAWKPLKRIPRNLPIPPEPKAPVRISKPLWGALALAFGISLYGSTLITSTLRASRLSEEVEGTSYAVNTQTDVAHVYDRTASSFDADVGWSEKLSGINRERRRLAGECKGHVLEVSSGTARNLGYYHFGKYRDGWYVKSLTLVDLSEEMVKVANSKWDALKSGGKIVGVPVRFVRGDVRGEMLPPPVAPSLQEDKERGGERGQQVEVKKEVRQRGYDTIFQTMGLCSTPSPVQLLKNLAMHLNAENPDAKIILLEHGRSYYQWLNRILDSQASAHADQHGCWWNRDIGAIVEESGLEVLREKRRHFGTTWIFELKPRREALGGKAVKSMEMSQEKAEEVNESATTDKGAESQKNATRSSWLPRWG